MLERETENLRAVGIPILDTHLDEALGCLVVDFEDMESEYVGPVREVVGYDQPVLFRELEQKKLIVGEPPGSLLDICRVRNTLVESQIYRVEIDAERGLLTVSFSDLTDEDIARITGLVGADVPMELVERPWVDRIYVGVPTGDLEGLDSTLARLYQADSELTSRVVSGTNVHEDGFLEIFLWELDDYPETFEALRGQVGLETPLMFVLTHRVRWTETQEPSTPEACFESYLSLLDLPDAGYEIFKQTTAEAHASIFFLEAGERIEFQEVRLRIEDGSWQMFGTRKMSARSPSRDLEIAGYLTRVSRMGDQLCISRVNPLVRNLAEKTAYVTSVRIEVRNSTHTLVQTYGTIGKGLLDGIIRPGGVDTLDVVFPMGFWEIEGSVKTSAFPLEPARGRTYEIAISLKDGSGETLAEETFTHTFA